MELERSHQCSIASISEGSDDQPPRVAKVLVAVGDVRRNHPNDDLLVFKVVAKLRDPLEVGGCVHSITAQLSYNITSWGEENIIFVAGSLLYISALKLEI